MRVLGKTLAVGIPILLVAAAGWATLSTPASAPAVSAAAPQPLPSSLAQIPAALLRHGCPQLPSHFTGASVPSPVAQNARNFARTTGVRPEVLEYYSVFGDGFDPARASIPVSQRAVPLLQWIPRRTQLAAIAAGHYDRYLQRFASNVRRFSCPILLSFAHEMNGPWWSWGKGRQSAADYRAAWRHIYTVFAAARARNVIWVWNPNVSTPSQAAAPPGPWWPGARYVSMIALDGYDWSATDTYASVFHATLAAVRAIAPGKPVMIAETGAYPGAIMAQRIHGLFSGAVASHLAGIIYFDHLGHNDWRLEGHPAAIAAFRAGARALAASPS